MCHLSCSPLTCSPRLLFGLDEKRICWETQGWFVAFTAVRCRYSTLERYLFQTSQLLNERLALLNQKTGLMFNGFPLFLYFCRGALRTARTIHFRVYIIFQLQLKSQRSFHTHSLKSLKFKNTSIEAICWTPHLHDLVALCPLFNKF